MNCRLVDRYLSSYIDGELDGETMIHVRKHILSCAFCETEHKKLISVKRKLSNMKLVHPAESFEEKLLTHVLKSDVKIKPKSRANIISFFGLNELKLRYAYAFLPGIILFVFGWSMLINEYTHPTDTAQASVPIPPEFTQSSMTDRNLFKQPATKIQQANQIDINNIPIHVVYTNEPVYQTSYTSTNLSFAGFGSK